MVLVKYIGDRLECKVSAGSARYDNWQRFETKDICPRIAMMLLRNKKDFQLVDDVINVESESIVKSEEQVNTIDVDGMDKDALLDFTALKDIEADYTMSVSKLRKLVKKYLSESE